MGWCNIGFGAFGGAWFWCAVFRLGLVGWTCGFWVVFICGGWFAWHAAVSGCVRCRILLVVMVLVLWVGVSFLVMVIVRVADGGLVVGVGWVS